MADMEQLRIIMQGADVWNKWKESRPDMKIDLTGADLSNLNLKGINLYKANLIETNLQNADLSDAILDFAWLHDANLVSANLHCAHFEGAIFETANLTGANLSNTHSLPLALNHWKANNAPYFRNAKLVRANLTESNFYGADFRWVDLSYAVIKNANIENCDFYGAIFVEANLYGSEFGNSGLSDANLQRANLQKTNLSNSRLRGCILIQADLQNANLSRSNLQNSDLAGANLSETNLTSSDLSGANLTGANLRKANLNSARLVNVKVDEAILYGCSVYGASVWDLDGAITDQRDIVITRPEESVITVDNIKIAQFFYLILNNEEIKNIINSLTSKSVLILGRFTPERKSILDAIRNKLRDFDLLPIMFDFDRPIDKDLTETIKTLAGLCLFVIADITNPKSSPLELQATIPDFQIPFVPIIQEGEKPFAMMSDLQNKYNWVLNTHSYDSAETLMKTLKRGIVEPAMKKHAELRRAKAEKTEIISLKGFLEEG